MSIDNDNNVFTAARKLRGFALLTPERRREISSKGGKNAHANGTAHRWTPEQAREAGRKGGMTSRCKQTIPDTKPEIPPSGAV